MTRTALYSPKLPPSKGSPLEVSPLTPETGSCFCSDVSLVPQTALAAAFAILLIVSILALKVYLVLRVYLVCMER
jgi:hypothetical protein